MNYKILENRVDEACNKLAAYGVEGCDDREITLACFGMIMFNCLEGLKKVIIKGVIAFVVASITMLISLLLAVLL